MHHTRYSFGHIGHVRALISHVQYKLDHVRRKRVLEIAAGTGLLGVALAMLGATVTLTDMVDHPTRCLLTHFLNPSSASLPAHILPQPLTCLISSLKRYFVPLLSKNLRRNLSLALSGAEGVVLGDGVASGLDWNDVDKVRRNFPPGEADTST